MPVYNIEVNTRDFAHEMKLPIHLIVLTKDSYIIATLWAIIIALQVIINHIVWLLNPLL